MKTNSARYEIDMCNGPLFTGILRFALPLIATNLLQLAFNAADMIVRGRFSGSPTALAAVGATGSLINLMVSLFTGLSIGAGVCVAQGIGAKDYDRVSRAVHTAIPAAIIGKTVPGLDRAVRNGEEVRYLEPNRVEEYERVMAMMRARK